MIHLHEAALGLLWWDSAFDSEMEAISQGQGHCTIVDQEMSKAQIFLRS